MIVTFKTASNEAFKIEFDENVTVKDVKEKIQAEKGVNYPVEWQTLIYGGKILKDEETLAQVKLDEKKFIALMLLKPKLAKAEVTTKEVEEEKEEAKVDSANEGASTQPEKVTGESSDKVQGQADSTQAPPLAKAEPPAEAPTVPAPLESANDEFERLVNDITSMGFQRLEVRKALRLAFNNPDRAVEYLTTGFPPDESGDSVESTVASQADRGKPIAGSDPLAALRSYPGFARMRNAVQQNPEMLQDLISELEQANPSLIALINANQQAFVDLMNEQPQDEEAGAPIEGAQVAPREVETQVVRLLPQDMEIIERLKSMGFPESAVIEAYFACEKNETLAVNFLLQSMEEDDDGSLEPPQAQ